MKVKTLAVYSIIHALVDMVCIGFIASFYNVLDLQIVFYMAIVYNILAFGLQAPFGFYVDKLQKPVEASLLGLIFTGIGLLFFWIPWIGIIFLGLGNALYHVGGGIISLNITPKKATAPGIYVAPGAIGVSGGVLLGTTGNFNIIIFLGLLLISGLFIKKIPIPKINYSTKIKDFRYFEIIVLLLLLSICVRAIVGLSLTLPWKSNIFLLGILTLGIVLGKAFGGIIGDKFGWLKTGIFGLLLSAPLLAFGSHIPVFAIVGAFLFNFTMPITLTSLSNMLPGRYGFAFGLTTLSLLIGALFVFVSMKRLINNQWIMFTVIIIGAILFYVGLKKYNLIRR